MYGRDVFRSQYTFLSNFGGRNLKFDIFVLISSGPVTTYSLAWDIVRWAWWQQDKCMRCSASAMHTEPVYRCDERGLECSIVYCTVIWPA